MINIGDNANLKDKKKQYRLIPLEDTSKYLSSAFLCIKDFFKLLRSSPELIYRIITKAEPKDLSPSFIYFISNNFFNNILSPRLYSKELLLLVTHLLYDQISSLKNISDFSKILENSNVFAILRGIKYQKDVMTFFELVLKDIIEDYENSESNILDFNIESINKYLLDKNLVNANNSEKDKQDKQKELEKEQKKEKRGMNHMYKMSCVICEDSRGSNKSLNYNELENEKEEQINDDIYDARKLLSKYLVDLTKKEIVDLINKEKNELKRNYLRDHLEYAGNDDYFFANSRILERVSRYNEIERILYYYQTKFFNVILIINKLIKNIDECVEIIPYNIKYICKIISITLKKQFKQITKRDIYKCVGEFFFIFILEEFFTEPDCSTLITSMIIGKETKKNLKVIFKIWKQLVSFNLFPNNNEFAIYTPFNWYLIETVEKIFDLCEKILVFNFPESDYIKNDNNDIIDDTNKIINSNIFAENSTFYSYSVCYNIYDLTTLLNIIKNNKNYIFENKNIKNEIAEFEACYNNIRDKKDIIKKLKSGDENNINYYIYYEIFYSKKYQDILFKTIKQEEIFNIKEIKNPKNEKEICLNKIIRIKNLLTDLLFKSDDLSKIKFNKQNIDFNNAKEIIQELSQYYKNKSTLYKCYSQSSSTDIDIDYNDIYIDNSNLNNINPENNGLPLFWYSNTLLSCFQELEQDNNINNDGNNINYIDIFISLKEEIINCINKYNFEDLGIALESLKNMRNYINDYRENQDKYKALIINTNIRNFMENEIIEVEIKYVYNKEEKFINIIKKEDSINFKFGQLDEFTNVNQKDDVINCKNIPEFIEKFPSFIIAAKQNNKNIFKIEKEIKIKKHLINYLNIVKEHLITKFNAEEINEVYSKVKKRIMIKLYDKLFPKKANDDDERFYQQCLRLSWIEPKHLKQENLFIDNFLPITNDYFEQINNEKSAVGKLEILSKIFDAINNVIIFNKGGNFSTDDIAPIFEYALIKAHPKRLSSNIQFLQIFMKKNEDLKERMYFDYLNAYMNIIIKANYTHFNDVTEEEFNSKCNESLEKEYVFETTPNTPN